MRHTIPFLALAMVSILLSRPIPVEAIQLSGDFRQGGLITGRVEPGTQLYFAGRPVRVGPRGRFALGLGRKAPERVPLSWRSPDGTFHQMEMDVAQRRYETQRINGLSESRVNPGEEALERIRKEQRRVRKAREGFSALEAFRSEFIWPPPDP